MIRMFNYLDKAELGRPYLSPGVPGLTLTVTQRQPLKIRLTGAYLDPRKDPEDFEITIDKYPVSVLKYLNSLLEKSGIYIVLNNQKPRSK